MAKQKKLPIRMCCGCGESFPKRELIRIVKSAEGNISLDKTGKKSGRGAYICPKLECLAKAQKNRRIEKVFSCQIPTEVYEVMKNELTKDS
ncbi:MAG: YlxR family protein [Ruminococcus sp.]|nr:YlxR family protein [Ruminococcus sp.]MCD7801136.1 YlxR family protein [Ruminococcus sp.]